MSELHMNDKMFEILTESSTDWGPQWAEQADRFEPHLRRVGRHYDEDKTWQDMPDFTWGMAYWVGDNSASAVLATSYLASHGWDYELVWDMAEHPNGKFHGWLILTDYVRGTYPSKQLQEVTR